MNRLLHTPLARVLYPLLPASSLQGLPDVPVNRETAKGRVIYEGAQRGWGLEYGDLYKAVSRDPLYRAARALARGRSVLDERRRMNLFLIIRFFFEKLADKNIIEFGVFKGGNVLFMAHLLQQLYPGALVYGLDTFEGMPETEKSLDLHGGGDFSDTNMEDIRSAAEKFGLSNVRLVKGDVRETLGAQTGTVRFGLAHIDLDIYDPIVFVQREIRSRMTPNGYLVYDDATTSSCPGATFAVEEMIQAGMHSEQIWPHFVFRA